MSVPWFVMNTIDITRLGFFSLKSLSINHVRRSQSMHRECVVHVALNILLSDPLSATNHTLAFRDSLRSIATLRAVYLKVCYNLLKIRLLFCEIKVFHSPELSLFYFILFYFLKTFIIIIYSKEKDESRECLGSVDHESEFFFPPAPSFRFSLSPSLSLFFFYLKHSLSILVSKVRPFR